MSDPGLAAFGSSFSAITLAELGDKTFFMALILATRHAHRWVFLGFGIKLLVDAGRLSADAAQQEQREAEQAVVAADKQQVSPRPLAGHALGTTLAVGAGHWIGSRVDERLLYRLSGGLFLLFGLAALGQALG